MGRATVKPSDQKKSKNQLRRERAKLLKQQGQTKIKENVIKKVIKPTIILNEKNKTKSAKKPTKKELQNLEEAYKGIFEKFEVIENENDDDNNLPNEKQSDVKSKDENAPGIIFGSDEEAVTEDETFDVTANNKQLSKAESTQIQEENDKLLSKRKFKKLYSIPLSILKAESKHPEYINWMDANSPDPRLYIYLKTLPNSVFIPSNWQSKKSFLSSKRGIERPPFELPEFIKDTGILEMRNIVEEAENPDNQSTLKQRMRERVQPKSGQLDIDYNKLHDAFFKYQKRPPMLKFGELYTESTNNDDLKLKDKLSHMKVGVLSRRLKLALGMIDPNGNVKNKLPPWYFKMKDLGPPPSYPFMRIDKNGKISFDNPNELNIGPPIVTQHWGTLINDLNDFDSEEEDEDKNKQATKETEKKNGFDRSRGDILLNTFGEDPMKKSGYVPSKTNQNKNNHRQHLYTVLQSDSKQNSNSIFGSQTASYKMPPSK